MRLQFTAVSETPDDAEQESETPRTSTSSLTSIDSTCSSRGSTVQVGGAMSSLLSRGAPPVDQFSSFGNPLAEAAAEEAAEAAAAAATSTASRYPSGSSVMDTIGHSVGLRLAHGGVGGAPMPRAPGSGGATMGWETHGAVEDSGLVHQESDGAWRVQWRPLSAPAPPRHVPRPAPPHPAPQRGTPLPQVERSKQCASAPPLTCTHTESMWWHCPARPGCGCFCARLRPCRLSVIRLSDHIHAGRCEPQLAIFPFRCSNTWPGDIACVRLSCQGHLASMPQVVWPWP